jgi:hypothetical protein
MSGNRSDSEPWRPTPTIKSSRLKKIPITSGVGGASAGGGAGSECDVHEITNLNSPQRSVLSKLAVGSTLKIKLNGSVLQAVTSTGDIVGAITSPGMEQIRICIRKRKAYIAIVRAINGGQCEVEIKRI